ncbi:unnamed protein product [Lymnaea stagnalis]|uniref:Heme-binding protein 2 n=1 Tax=Lymnaea stagnalis TaxID=6523 RepID=A0AAV2H7C0_LYMST
MFGIVKSFIKGLQKPEHSLILKEEKFEIRKYPAAKWVSTAVKGMSHKDASSEAFRRLFKYIQGENEKKVTIEMTVPVTIKVEPGEGPACETTFTESFYIPVEHQENPPAPTNTNVFIETRPELTVYVGTFGGFGDDEKWIYHGKLLSDAIGDETKFHSDYYYTVGYDAPFKLIGRTNEIWFVKKEN